MCMYTVDLVYVNQDQIGSMGVIPCGLCDLSDFVIDLRLSRQARAATERQRIRPFAHSLSLFSAVRLFHSVLSQLSQLFFFSSSFFLDKSRSFNPADNVQQSTLTSSSRRRQSASLLTESLLLLPWSCSWSNYYKPLSEYISPSIPNTISYPSHTPTRSRHLDTSLITNTYNQILHTHKKINFQHLRPYFHPPHLSYSDTTVVRKGKKELFVIKLFKD